MSHADSLLAGLLYVSRLAPAEPLSSISTITRQARVRNATRGLTGVLVFDGETFVQYVEGPQDGVDSLREGLGRDLRHQDMEILWSGWLPTRHFAGWHMGYLTVEHDTHELAHWRGMRDEVGLEALLTLLSAIDIGNRDLSSAL